MSTPIQPAMTAEEWAKSLREIIDGYVDMELGVIDVRIGDYGPPDPQAKALAALLLHDEPFGFTWEMYDALVDALACSGTVSWPDNLPLAEKAADRIAALLPPRET